MGRPVRVPGSTNAKSGGRAARHVGSARPALSRVATATRGAPLPSRRSGRSIAGHAPWPGPAGYWPPCAGAREHEHAVREPSSTTSHRRRSLETGRGAPRGAPQYVLPGRRHPAPRTPRPSTDVLPPVRMAREHEHERATVEQHDVARRRRCPPRGQHEHTAVVALHQYPVASWSCHDGPPARIDTIPARLPVFAADPGHAAAG